LFLFVLLAHISGAKPGHSGSPKIFKEEPLVIAQAVFLHVGRKKSWWNCVKNDMESLGLSPKDAQYRNKWKRRINVATG